MATKSPERPDNNSDAAQPSVGSGSSFLGAVMRSPFSWMRARGQRSNLKEVKDDAMVVDDSAGMHEEDSFDSIPTQSLTSQSSQEYEMSWGSLLSRPEELEKGAASAELVDKPPVSRGSSGSSLGKRCRSDSTVGPPHKKRTSNYDDDPFIVPDFRPATINLSSAVSIRKIGAQPSEELLKSIQSLSWGTQWVIGELITSGLLTYDAVKPQHLLDLRGSNEQAASKVVQLLCPPAADASEGPTKTLNYAQDHDAKTLWAELDREEAFLKANPHAGLGCGVGYGVDANWYGGQVHFTAKLKEKEKGKKHGRGTDGIFEIVLQKPELGTSNRFARRFGSRRFIRVRVPKTIGSNKSIPSSAVIDFFRAPFLLHGRVFRAFSAKDGNVFLVETSEPEICRPAPGPPALSFLEFLDFHNPRALNSQQALAKWSARFALGLSNSVPGLRVESKNIHRIPDIVAPYTGGGKPPPEKIMTDGCGFINAYGMRKLQAILQWERLPTAVQVRIGGVKGLLLLHPDGKYAEGELETHVWIRPSQTKIHYDDSKQPDPAHLTIDVLQPARVKYPSRLSAETIINIAHNQAGPPGKKKFTVLKQLMNTGLEEAIGGLVGWLDAAPHEAPHAMPLLWHEISKAGGIMGMRMARDFSGSARARGYASRWDEVEQDEEEDRSSAQNLTGISIAGHPATPEETAMDLLSAGFKPSQSTYLSDRIKYTIKKVTTKYTQKFRITVPGSADALCVPDPKNVLEPGQVYFRTSQPIKNQYGVDVDVLQGPALVARHPTKTPSDVQRVQAVFKQELFEHTDVLIFSTKGDRSPASLLAGGDYDGDTVTIIWESGLVDEFVNADLGYSMPPPELDDNFEQDANETVAQFQERTAHMLTEDLIRNLQTALLGALKDVSIVGSYSIFHDNAVYSKGYDHPETIRLAYMFCACLDGGKSGLRVKDKAFKADKKLWDRRGPQWKETDETDGKQTPLHRDKKALGDFVMDELKSHGEALSKKLSKKWDEKLPPIITPDGDLIRPWTQEIARAIELEGTSGNSQFSTDLKKISDHVDIVRDQFNEAWRANSGSPNSKALYKSPSSRQRSPNIGTKINSEIIRKFSEGPKGLLAYDDVQCEELKASYAYWSDTRRKPYKAFAWKVAFRELLRIKTTSLPGGGAVVIPEFYRCFDIQSGVKALAKRTGQ